MIEYEEALGLMMESWPCNGRRSEAVPLLQAVGRYTAVPIFSDRNYPPFDRATMDGYAVRLSDCNSSEPLSVTGTIFAGDDISAMGADPVRIMTGAAVPAGADCVIPREETEEDAGGPNTFRLTSKARLTPCRNIARCGEDMKAGDEVFPAGTRIEEGMIGLLASIGQANPLCYTFPRVTIVSTGNEVVGIESMPGPTQIRNSNALTLSIFFYERGIPVQRCLHVRDDAESAYPLLEECLDTDLLILSGAVSAGEADFVPGLLRSLGVEQIFHGVAIKPGKPVWSGRKENTLVIALPGNPVAVQVAISLFFEPLMRHWNGARPQADWYLPLLSEVRHDARRLQLRPGRVVMQRDRYGVELLQTNGSGDLRTLVGADGLVFIDSPAGIGDFVRFRPTAPFTEILR